MRTPSGFHLRGRHSRSATVLPSCAPAGPYAHSRCKKPSLDLFRLQLRHAEFGHQLLFRQFGQELPVDRVDLETLGKVAERKSAQPRSHPMGMRDRRRPNCKSSRWATESPRSPPKTSATVHAVGRFDSGVLPVGPLLGRFADDLRGVDGAGAVAACGRGLSAAAAPPRTNVAKQQGHGAMDASGLTIGTWNL